MNGLGFSITNFCIPFAILLNVFSARGFFRSNIDGHSKSQLIHSAAVCQGNSFPLLTSSLSGFPCVGLGNIIDLPSLRNIINNRFRIVGAP